MFQDMDKIQKKQISLSYTVFALNGMLGLCTGSLLPFIREARGLDYAFGGLLVSLHSVGNLVSSFFAGMLQGVLGRKRSILLFNACFALAFLLIIAGKSPFLMAAAFLMTGLARGASSNFNNTMVNEIAPGKASALNGLHAMFSIGAFLFPFLFMLMTEGNADGWITACYFMLAMGLLNWILYFIYPVEEPEQQKKEKTSGASKEIWGFFREPLFYLCTGTLFFYLCAEQGVIGWLITYFKDTGLMSSGLSQIMASVQWIMILIGRLSAAYLSTRVDKNKLVRCMGIGFCVFCLLLLFSRNVAIIVAGLIGFGLSMAGIYPTTVSFAGQLMKKYTYAWSFILTLASLGSIIMPSVIGAVADHSGIAFGMSTVVVVTAIDMVFIFLLTAYRKKHGN